MERIARRAPGSADMRAALAALYWSEGRVEAAEDQWCVVGLCHCSLQSLHERGADLRD
jgi:hypothetical protein